jgi:hypothetical protein
MIEREENERERRLSEITRERHREEADCRHTARRTSSAAPTKIPHLSEHACEDVSDHHGEDRRNGSDDRAAC